MKVLVVLFALAGAALAVDEAAANNMPAVVEPDIHHRNLDMAAANNMPAVVEPDIHHRNLDMAAVVEPDIHHRNLVLDEKRFINLYSYPQYGFPYEEKFDYSSLIFKPVVVAVKSYNSNVIKAFLLKNGFSSYYTVPEFQFMKQYLLSGKPKVGLMLSAARFLDLPEMKMLVPSITLASTATLGQIYEADMKYATKLPWVFVTEMEKVLPADLEKLSEVARYEVNADYIKVLKSSDIKIPRAFAWRQPATYVIDDNQNRYYNPYSRLNLYQPSARPTTVQGYYRQTQAAPIDIVSSLPTSSIADDYDSDVAPFSYRAVPYSSSSIYSPSSSYYANAPSAYASYPRHSSEYPIVQIY